MIGNAPTSANVWVFTDLDDTLFSTLRKIPASQQRGKTLAARSAGSVVTKDSYMTRKHSALVDWLDLSRCVPVTARGSEAYSRVTLPFAGPAAILANGAVMLQRDGTVDESWAAIVSNVLRDLQDPIHQLSDQLQTLAKQRAMNIRTWAVSEPSCGAVYAVAKSNDSPQGEGLGALLQALQEELLAQDAQALEAWRFHINGNNLSVTPSGVSKAIAVRHLLHRLHSAGPETDETILSVGVGDSASDLEFMRLCDVWLTPTQSQLDQLISPP